MTLPVIISESKTATSRIRSYETHHLKMNTILIRPFATLKIITLLALFATSGCHWNWIAGNGHITTENRTVTNFTDVEADGAFEIIWASGTPACSVTTDQNLLTHVDTTMSGNKLRLHSHGSMRPTHGIKVTLASSQISGARLTGATRFTGMKIAGKGFYLDATGASRVNVDGNVTELMASMTGASRLDAGTLQTETAELSISGAGRADVAVSKALKVAISGAGKVVYSGNPTVEKRISGAGSVRPRD